MKCRGCQQDNPSHADFCLKCGSPLKGTDPTAKRYTDLKDEVDGLRRSLTEALEQQTATSNILRVISRSPTNLQPVMDTVAENAARLCEASDAQIFRLDGGAFRLAASHGPLPPARQVPVTGGSVAGRAVIDRQTVHIRDIATEPSGEFPDSLAKGSGLRTVLAVPLLREGVPIGVVVIRRMEVRPFSDKHIELLQTFADQAVIAIENVRLFNATQEALEQQTATSEILRVISTSPTDLQPVFETIAENALRLCDAGVSGVLRFDGALVHLAAYRNFSSAMRTIVPHDYPMAPTRHRMSGRAILDRTVVHVPDVLDDPDYPQDVARSTGWRSFLSVPMLREGDAIGAVTVVRPFPGPFPDRQIELLKTFADQAIIAIENVRLFKELQARNQELTVALAQQTATSEVLAVISGAQTAVQPVFEAIAQSARRLCEASYSSVYRLDNQVVHLVAHNHQTPEAAETFRYAWPMPLTGDSFVALAIRENAVIHTDMQEDPTASAALIARGKAVGHRRILVVPIVREGQPIGAIRVSRVERTPFAEQHIALLKTFADQAVIAIENVRLFKELEAANRELAAASQHKSEFLANMSHELRTPLNAIIGFSEVLSERMFGELNDKQDEYLKDIHVSGQHLLSLINDILDLSKIEAGRMELEVTQFDLPMAIDNALTLVRERAARRSIALHTTVDGRLRQVQGDERKIRQVLLNLLSNAIKFTPEGGRIEVGAKPVNGSIEVSVSDTGVGIAPEDQEAVFEEFRQVGMAEKKVEGTGLGLALSRKFIELHGGKIWVKSQVGQGSTFAFTLPVGRGE